MNKRKILSILFVISLLKGMEQPPGRQDPLLIPTDRFQPDELQFPSENPGEDLVDFLGVVDSMSRIKDKIIQEKIARKLNRDPVCLASLDPKLARTTSKNIEEFMCQSTILDGIYRFDKAQEKLAKLHPSQNSLVTKSEVHDEYLEIETQELEALCVFVAAYEKDCFDAFNYIIPTLGSILLIEQKRKDIRGPNYAIYPKLSEFRNRLISITRTEERRKNGHRVTISSKKIEPDFNKAGEYYARAQKTLSLAKEYEKRIIQNKEFQLTAAAYSDLHTLYCMGVKKIIKSFHVQPNDEEKKRIFKEILTYSSIIEDYQKKQLEIGHLAGTSAIFTEICSFITFNASIYDQPEPEIVNLPQHEPSKNILQKLFALIKKPFTKK